MEHHKYVQFYVFLYQLKYNLNAFLKNQMSRYIFYFLFCLVLLPLKAQCELSYLHGLNMKCFSRDWCIEGLLSNPAVSETEHRETPGPEGCSLINRMTRGGV